MNEAPPLPRTMRRVALEQAIKNVDADRHREYGDPGQSLRHISALWNAYLSMRTEGFSKAIDSYDVAMMMSLLKIARAARRPASLDSLIDQAGYAAIAAELQDREQPKATPAPGVPLVPQPGPPGGLG